MADSDKRRSLQVVIKILSSQTFFVVICPYISVGYVEIFFLNYIGGVNYVKSFIGVSYIACPYLNTNTMRFDSSFVHDSPEP
jgi:hypothetical protein